VVQIKLMEMMKDLDRTTIFLALRFNFFTIVQLLFSRERDEAGTVTTPLGNKVAHCTCSQLNCNNVSGVPREMACRNSTATGGQGLVIRQSMGALTRPLPAETKHK
jgi:hypothetical protein